LKLVPAKYNRREFTQSTITDVVFKDIQLGDLICPVPKRFILEGDANDFIEVAVIESVSATVKE
jgi:hypothetical protein